MLIPPGISKPCWFVVLGALTLEVIGVVQILPYVNEMVSLLMNVEKGDPRVGFWTAVLFGSYNLAEAFLASLWGYLADRVGYRPMFAVSFAGGLLANLVFGYSMSLYVVVCARLFDGIFCGNRCLATAYIGHYITEDNDTLALAAPAISTSMGMLFGPILGGFLAEPALWAPGIFGGTLFESHPFFLPNLFFASLKLILLVMSLRHVVEPIQRGQSKQTLTFVPDIPFTPLLKLHLTNVIIYFGYLSFRLQGFIIFAGLPRSMNGLAFNEHEFSTVQVCAAIALVLFNVSLYPAIVRRLDAHTSCMVGLIGMIALTLPMPVIDIFADPDRYGFWRYVPIGIWQIGFQPVSSLAMTTSMALLNREMPSAHRATIAGFSQSAGALVRGVCAYLGGGMMEFGCLWDKDHGLSCGRYVAFYVALLIPLYSYYLIWKTSKLSKAEDAEDAEPPYVSLDNNDTLARNEAPNSAAHE